MRSPASRAPLTGDLHLPSKPLPTRDELASSDVAGFLGRLDHALSAIASESSLAALLPPEAALEMLRDPRFSGADAAFRATFRSLLLATSFRDLPDAARAHPAVQDRMWSAMEEMDSAVHGIGDALSSLTAAERDEITRALREDPALGERVLATLDDEAAKAGVSGEARAHFGEMGKHACFRLRQSTSGFIEEHLAKLHKARPRDADEAERYLAAQWGDARFSDERAWQVAVRDEWEHILTLEKARFADSSDDGGISPDDAYAPPAASSGAPPPVPPAFDPNRGKKVLRVGAWLFGIGILSAATGGILVQSREDSAIVTGLIAFTVAALLSLGGLVCLMVGGILRLHTRSQMRAMEGAGP